MVESRSLEDIVIDLYREDKWKEIINLKDNINNNFEKHRLLWVWPSIDDFEWLKDVLYNKGVREIVSLGCGSGLLEWLIEKHSSGIFKIVGIEVDRSWWCSVYSPPLFLKNVYFIDEKNDEDKSVEVVSKSQAMLFCYFNNGPAFVNYVNNYSSKIIVIIGPGEGRGSCTDPAPFDKKIIELGFELKDWREICDTKDYIAVYTR